ncbi:MAG TPA: molecular chaperone DnaJ [Azospirillaceae bacterium]|nr:molecular chaperone DnaJ [Azospirillaceae bacterium]
MVETPEGGSARFQPQPAALDGDMLSCWFCARPVSPRAFFCHQCGSLQPPTGQDAFQRLGLPRRFDIEPGLLERQHAGFSRMLDPERFRNRGPKEKQLLERHRTELAGAHAVLRDPASRARHLLELEGRTPAVLPSAEPDPLWVELEGAADTASLDRAATAVGRETESTVQALSAAFRSGQLDRAAQLTLRLERLGHLADLARRRRASLEQ